MRTGLLWWSFVAFAKLPKSVSYEDCLLVVLHITYWHFLLYSIKFHSVLTSISHHFFKMSASMTDMSPRPLYSVSHVDHYLGIGYEIANRLKEKRRDECMDVYVYCTVCTVSELVSGFHHILTDVGQPSIDLLLKLKSQFSIWTLIWILVIWAYFKRNMWKNKLE